MTKRSCKKDLTTASAVLLAAVVGGARPASGASWQQTAAGTYSWIDGANWDAAFPNAAGVVANFSVDLAGAQTVNLNQPITIGTLNAGDTSGTSGLTIASGTGSNTLVFQGASAGAPTAINLNSTSMGQPLTINADINLGGSSPLTATINGTTSCTMGIHNLNLNGNTFKVAGPSSVQSTLGILGAITGNGTFVQNGPGTWLQQSAPAFTGTITINAGQFRFMNSQSISAVSQINLNGNSPLWGPGYAAGGSLQIGNDWRTMTTVPDRLNHNAVMTFNGGWFDYEGQPLNSSLGNPIVTEQVRQLQFNGGFSHFTIKAASGTSGSTFLVNDPTNGVVRQQGATVSFSGVSRQGEVDIWQPNFPVPVTNTITIASGMSKYLVGGGGAAGTNNISIIPWASMQYNWWHVDWHWPCTYDAATGTLRDLNPLLNPSEYDMASIFGAPDRNIYNVSPALGDHVNQTINSYCTDGMYGNPSIGKGSTLTITSGALRFIKTGGAMDTDPNHAGTINFGAAEGIIWTSYDVTSSQGPVIIGSVIAGSGGLTKSGMAPLALYGASTYTGKTVVNSGMLQVGNGTLTNSCLGNGDVEVNAGATLLIKTQAANAIADNATVTLDDTGDINYGMVSLESGINEKVAGLVLNGVAQPAGTYGSSSSTATYQLDNYFSGPGILTVVPEPASLACLSLAGFLLRRRR